jgi:hypothetical protein
MVKKNKVFHFFFVVFFPGIQIAGEASKNAGHRPLSEAKLI